MGRAWTGSLLGACLAASLGGCVERVVYDSLDPFKELAARSRDPYDRASVGDGGGGAGLGRNVVTRPSGWGVFLAAFEGDDAAKRADRLLQQLQKDHHLFDAWIWRRNAERYEVYRGQYIDPGSYEAVNALRQVHLLETAEGQRFPRAELVMLSTPDDERSLMDLSQHVGMLSLQVGVYDEQMDEDYMEAAELAAAELRAQGYPAYFYHGANLSMVTVGLFDQQRAFTQRGEQTVYSPQVREVQEAFPYNLLNGRTVIENRNGHRVEQPSFLVRVDP